MSVRYRTEVVSQAVGSRGRLASRAAALGAAAMRRYFSEQRRSRLQLSPAREPRRDNRLESFGVQVIEVRHQLKVSYSLALARVPVSPGGFDVLTC